MTSVKEAFAIKMPDSPGEDDKSLAKIKISHAPLRPIRNWLRAFQIFGGFPLKICNDEATIFANSTGGALYGFVMLTLMLVVVTMQQYLMYYKTDGFGEFLNHMRSYKMTDTEIASYFFTFVPQFIGLLGNLCIMRRKGPQLTDLLQKIDGFSELFINEAKWEKWTRRTEIRICLMMSGVIVGAVFSVTANSYLDILTTGGKVLFAVIVFIEVAFIQLPPMSLSVQMVTVQILNYLTSLTRSLVENNNDFVSLISVHKKSKNVDTFVEWSVATSNHLLDIIKVTNKTLGSLIFLEIAICVVNLVLTLFFSIGIVTSVTLYDHWPNLAFFHNLYQLTLAILSVMRLYGMMMSGERLSRSTLELQESLESLGIAYQPQLTEVNRANMSLTVARITSKSAAIRPVNGFDLTISTALTCIGLLITYIVILLQFKFSEISGQANLF